LLWFNSTEPTLVSAETIPCIESITLFFAAVALSIASLFSYRVTEMLMLPSTVIAINCCASGKLLDAFGT